MTSNFLRISTGILSLVFAITTGFAEIKGDASAKVKNVNLLKIYPTTLTHGRTDPSKARAWKFTKSDVYLISEFNLKIKDDLQVRVGPADLGIGHCSDGAVWAVIIPRKPCFLKSSAAKVKEKIDHLWLRFHPAEINKLFPPGTVAPKGNKNLWAQILKIANHKIRSSWHAGGKAMIPGRKDLTVDADTEKGLRRFFVVDQQAQKARYVAAFKNRIVPVAKPFSKKLASDSFDRLWKEYDRNYAMFIIRPEVDWDALRKKYRPKALKCKTNYEFALVCAEMLAKLRDLHVWVQVDGKSVPVFNRPRIRNSNPSAHKAIIGNLQNAGKKIRWGKTNEKVGFVVVNSWSGGDELVDKFDGILEHMRDTRGLIVDVRLNGGGSEPLARKVAARFADKETVYAYSQYRNGAKHTDLTGKKPRKIAPRGPWRYDRPVIVLMGQKCMSSNESFISMMGQFPQVTTMGDHTCGSSGNPKFVTLPMGEKINLPVWIDLLPDGKPLYASGF